jgi:hypothetical protein
VGVKMTNDIDIDCYICSRPLTLNEPLYSIDFIKESISGNVSTVTDSDSMFLCCDHCRNKHQINAVFKRSLLSWRPIKHGGQKPQKITAIASFFKCDICTTNIPDDTDYFCVDHGGQCWKSPFIVQPGDVNHLLIACPDCAEKYELKDAVDKLIAELINSMQTPPPLHGV